MAAIKLRPPTVQAPKLSAPKLGPPKPTMQAPLCNICRRFHSPVCKTTKVLPRADLETIMMVKDYIDNTYVDEMAGDPLRFLAFLDELIAVANVKREGMRSVAAKRGYRSALDGKVVVDGEFTPY